MRRLIAVSLFTFVFLAAVGGPARAQESSPTPHPFPRVQGERVRTAAERVHGLLGGINSRRLTSARSVVERLQRILERMSTVVERRQSRGLDVDEATEAIRRARTALDEAREAIREQSERTYILEDATDRTIGDRLRAVRDQMAEDLRAVHAAVRDAIQAVRDVARALRASSVNE